MKKTLRELWTCGQKVFVRGNWWTLDLALNKNEMILWREVRVKNHFRGRKLVGGYRVVQMRRPADLVVDHEA